MRSAVNDAFEALITHVEVPVTIRFARVPGILQFDHGLQEVLVEPMPGPQFGTGLDRIQENLLATRVVTLPMQIEGQVPAGVQRGGM